MMTLHLMILLGSNVYLIRGPYMLDLWCWNVVEILLKDHLLNLAFLITWCCRLAENGLSGVGGMRQGTACFFFLFVCYFLSFGWCSLSFWQGVSFWLLFEMLTGKHGLVIVQKLIKALYYNLGKSSMSWGETEMNIRTLLHLALW